MLTLSASGWWLLLIALGAVGLAAWSYANTRPALSRGWQWGLGALRAASLFLIAALLLEPFWASEQTTTRPPQLAVALDNSLSMQHTGIDTTGAPVSDQMDALLATWTSTLDAAPRAYPFDADMRPNATPAYDGTRTNITAALREVPLQYAPHTDTPLNAIALISDGQHNSGPLPLQAAEAAGVPIYPVVVGDTLPQRDVQVRRLRTNEVGYVDTPHPVEARIRSIDARGESVTVTLRRNDTVLDERQITLPEGTADQPVPLSYTPDEPGPHTLTVTVSNLPDQATDATNTQSTTVQIEDRARTAWIVAGSAFPDVGALRRALDRNPEWEVSATIAAPQGDLLTPLATADEAPDVVLLVGFPTADTPTRAVEAVRSWVDTQPLLVFWGPQVDTNRLANLTGTRLPVQWSPAPAREVRPTPTSDARTHPAWGDLDPSEAWAGLPPVLGAGGAADIRPGARVLLETEGGAPLLATLQRDRQRSALVSSYRTWRWTTLPASRSEAAALWPTLVTNLARWASTDVDTPVRIRPDAPVFAGTEAVTFSGRVLDGRGEPVSDAAVSLTITDDEEELPFTMQHVGGGQYQLDAGTLPAGSYTYTATAVRNGTDLGTDAGGFEIDAPNIEPQDTRANVELMEQIATRSGGTVLFLEDAEQLPEQLRTHPQFVETATTERSAYALAHAWPLLLLIVALLGSEWFFRKRQGLA